MRSPLNRREFLILGGAAVVDYTVAQGRQRQGGSPIPRFQVSLPIPPVLRPARIDATADYYEITQREAQVEILPGLRTEVWGYDGMFPGPTIKARRGRRVVVGQTNRLSVPTVVHLHGGVTPPDSDGFPTDLIMPGQSKTYVYPNDQRAATLWYHDHAMHHTGRNLYMGLAGLYLIEDDQESNLPLPRGAYDIPLIIQDRRFGADGALAYEHGVGHRGANGDTILVNGVPWPRMEVAARQYRFRILNASNARAYRLALSSGQRLVQIATEGGLLPRPVPGRSLPLAMAERAEVVIDFSTYPVGTRVVLQNLNGKGAMGEIMRFEVVRRERDDAVVPERLSVVEPLPEQTAVRTREFVFDTRPRFGVPPMVWTINGKQFEPERPIARPSYGDVEVWRFRSPRDFGLGMLHPVHLHLVNFQILRRNGAPPLPCELGWKDTVAVDKGEEVRVIVKFDGHRGRYLLHCHNLEHEDHHMMARFDVN
jgi:FtsP/CotA-like multicopper oxidase with cupredoxin domain